nr:sigma-70 domain-containing protein [Roseomonas pecuniae]
MLHKHPPDAYYTALAKTVSGRARSRILSAGDRTPPASISHPVPVPGFGITLADSSGALVRWNARTQKIAPEPISLETLVSDQEDSYLGDLIRDENAVMPFDVTVHADLSAVRSHETGGDG